MLSPSAVEIATNTVWEHKTLLKASDSSPLASLTYPLIERCLFQNSVKTDRVEALDKTEVTNLISNLSMEEGGDYDSLRVQLGDLVHVLTNVIRNNIYVTRNIVLPLTNEYTEQLNELVNKYAFAPNLALRITPDTKSNILNSTALRSLCSPHAQYTGSSATISCQADMSLLDLEKCLNTGANSLDKELQEWYEKGNLSNVLRDTYELVFLTGKPRMLVDVIGPDNYEHAIFAILLAKMFTKETPEGVDMSSIKYETELAKVIASASRYVMTAINKVERNVKTGQMVIKYPVAGVQYMFNKTHSGDNDIIVNNDLYDQFLSRGGKPELIIGAYLSDRKTDLDAILSNASGYQRAYDRAVQSGKLTKTNTMLTIVKTNLNSIGKKVLTDIQAKIEGDYNNTEYTGITYETSVFGRRVVEFTNAINVNHLDDLYILVRNFICDVFFAESEVGNLLKRIDMLDPNGETDVNDVAVIASIDLITDWLCKHVEVGKPELGIV